MALGPVNVPGAPGTTGRRGVLQLTNSTSSTSTTTAATPAAVRTAYNLANSALTKATDVETSLANLTIPVLSADPASPAAGQIWILSS